MFKERWYGSVGIWLVRLLNLNFDMGFVRLDWRGACKVALYKGKGDKYELSNSRGISLLRVVGKLFGRGACKVPLYKGKDDKCECSNSRGISLLSVVGKLFGRVLIKRVRGGIQCAIGEEQCGFRHGRGCMDQVFAVRQVCEKYLANAKDVFWAFVDLEKAYDTIDRWYVADAKSV